jgi:hypothetical protein
VKKLGEGSNLRHLLNCTTRQQLDSELDIAYLEFAVDLPSTGNSHTYIAEKLAEQTPHWSKTT